MKTTAEIIEMFRTDRAAAREMVNGWREDAAKLDAVISDGVANDKTPAESAAELVEAIGYDRAAWITATLVQAAAWDGRISDTAKTFAATVSDRLTEDASADRGIFCHAHKTHLDQFARAFAKIAKPEPEADELDAEAEEALVEEAEKELAAETVETIREAVEASPARSAWGRGVKVYAAELLDNLAEAVAGGWVTLSDVTSPKLLERALLNGADDWRMFSEGGCSLIHNADIAERLCNPTELKRTGGGRRDPNNRENWIEAQGRALYQAARLIAEKAKEVIAK